MNTPRQLLSIVIAVSLCTAPMGCGWSGEEWGRPEIDSTSSRPRAKTTPDNLMKGAEDRLRRAPSDPGFKVELGENLKIVVDDDSIEVEPTDQPNSTTPRQGGRPASPPDAPTKPGDSDADREADATPGEDGKSVEDGGDIPRGRPASPKGGLRSLETPDDSE